MKYHLFLTAMTIAACMFTFSCKKDKRYPDRSDIYGKWQRQAMADDENHNSNLDDAEIKKWLGTILVLDNNNTGSATDTYEDTNCQVVTRIIPFVWSFANGNQDILINEKSATSIKYLPPVLHIYSLSSSVFITISTDIYNQRAAEHWEIYAKQ